MGDTYKKIDYQLRPAKHIERKLMIESFKKLLYFGDIKEYEYIGMGSLYFVDIKNIYKELGITNLYSIEYAEDSMKKDRFKFNKPYEFVNLIFNDTSSFLASHPFNHKSIVWLDYDGSLESYMFNDFEYCTRKMKSGSILIFTVNCNFYSRPSDNTIDNEAKKIVNNRLPKFLDEFAQYLTRAEYKESELTPKRSHKVIRELFNNYIEQVIQNNNITIEEDHKKLCYKQLYYFRYNDGAPMITIGGVFYEKGDQDKYEQCQFERNEYLSIGDECYDIKAPLLTNKEKIFFLQDSNFNQNVEVNNGQMETEEQSSVTSESTQEEATVQESVWYNELKSSYEKIHRFMPNYLNIDMM